ncbi:hypothetical protein ACLOJK_004078 [Asimina triloba]
MDGRKISVGDCALFQSGKSLPHIGIIRWLSLTKEGAVTIGINWLCRPADVKLARGQLLDTAPNEVFYSFQKDETTAASLLHPCKVAFLRKGVELPSGVSSFVCRRVYDIANKCLWWLTDQDYIDEQQEEVDQLLDKTRLEMHAAVQSGGCSPKPLNGPTSTQQLKPSSEGIQNHTPFPSQGKGKKREGDQGPEPIKRVRSYRVDDGDSGQPRKEGMLKAEVAKIIDKGGLINLEAVEKLVCLMQTEKAEKKIDLSGRLMLVDVVAATEKLDCLTRFVHLRGVPILDEWLQEAHKRKIGDGSSQSDNSIEQFLSALLRALAKLPVNLHALRSCNVGKSVNNLRTHKNLEIRKKARTLVDTWRKRVEAEMMINDVEAEMKINDAKSGASQPISWPGKPGLSELSHGGNRRSGSSEGAAKCITSQLSGSRTGLVKHHGDSAAKSMYPGALKPTPSVPASSSGSLKDLHSKIAGANGALDIHLAIAKEEKSSSSGQSYSSDHAKSGTSASKDDMKCSPVGSNDVNKATGGSRSRKSSNGCLGSGASGFQKETTASGKVFAASKTTTPDKVSNSGPMSERAPDAHSSDHGNSHRLIVRLPNPGRSPGQSVSGGSFEDHSVLGSRASPGVPEKLDHFDRKLRGKNDKSQSNHSVDVNTDSWQNFDMKDGLAVLADGVRSPTAITDEEGSRNDIVKSVDILKGTVSSSGNDRGVFSAESKSGKQCEDSFSSINALVESCVKCSEVSSPPSADDDIGMNLLASVAAGEITKSNPVSPSSPGIGSPLADDFTGNGGKLRSSHEDEAVQGDIQLDDSANTSPKLGGDESIHTSMRPMSNISEVRSSLLVPEGKLPDEQSEQISLLVDSSQSAVVKSYMKCVVRPTTVVMAETSGITSRETYLPEGREGLEVGSATRFHEKQITACENNDASDIKPKTRSPSSDVDNCADEKNVESSMPLDSIAASSEVEGKIEQAASFKEIEEAIEESKISPLREKHIGNAKYISEDGGHLTEQQPLPDALNHSQALEGGIGDTAHDTGSILCAENIIESKPEKVECVEINGHTEEAGESGRVQEASFASLNLDDQAETHLAATVLRSNTVDGLLETKRKELSLSSPNVETPTARSQENSQDVKLIESKLSCIKDGKEDCMPIAECSLGNFVASDVVAKLDFDLNEGFAVDEGNPSEVITSATSGCMSVIDTACQLPLSISSLSNGSYKITVAAAAKGPFLHPEPLSRSKGDQGWKGSASYTSAFKPPDRRKGFEIPITDGCSSDTKQRQCCSRLDIDLNVADDRVLEDMASHGSVRNAGLRSVNTPLQCTTIASSAAPSRDVGLDLDLNIADEGPDDGHFSSSTSRRMELSVLPKILSTSGKFSSCEANVLRDFDLNDGPGVDEISTDVASQSHAKNNVQYLPPVSSMRINNTQFASISWFPPSNSYPAPTIPPLISDREQPYQTIATASAQKILGSATSGDGFTGDIYRSPMLSSSPAMAFSPTASFPFAGFPFSTSFPLASTSLSVASTAYTDSSSGPCFPTVPSQLVGLGSAISSQYFRPYLINLPEGATITSGAECNKKWGRQGLDLNAGPGGVDLGGRDERLSSTSRQFPVANSQILAEEHARMYQMAAATGGLKRKEPEGGWDVDGYGYRQTSWK